MVSKQRRTSYDATFKPKIIVYAEKYGNRKKALLWITVSIAVVNMMSRVRKFRHYKSSK
jgi:hypothetical protein